MPNSYKGEHQKRVTKQNPIAPAIKRQNMRMAERRVCQISISDGYTDFGIGTGFLIGPSLVITAYHVLEDVFDGLRSPGEISCGFDILGPEFAGKEKYHSLQNVSDWPSEVYSNKEPSDGGMLRTPENDEFDFVVFKLETDASLDVIEDAGLKVYRGFVNLKSRQAAVANETANILSFPGETPEILESTGPFLDSKIDRRIQYLANTDPGSSGGLVLNGHGLPVGYHSAGVEIDGKEMNQGIEFGAIIEFLGDYLEFEDPTLVLSEEDENKDAEEGRGEGEAEKTPPKAVLVYTLFLFTLLVSTVLTVFASSQSNPSQQTLVLSAALILVATFFAGLTAIRFLNMTFLSLAKSIIGWAALAPLVCLNVYACYGVLYPNANYFPKLTQDDVPVSKKPVFITRPGEEPDADKKAKYKTNRSGVVAVRVDDGKRYDFHVQIDNERCARDTIVDVSGDRPVINYQSETDCEETQSTSTEPISENRIESINPRSDSLTASLALGDTSAIAPWGLPRAETLINHDHFVIGYNETLRGANWVAHTIDTKNAISIGRSTTSYIYDPSIGSELQNGNEAYIGNDYDRGSLIRYSDEARGSVIEAKARSAKTFLYSVNVPMHEKANRRAYNRVEEISTKLSEDLGKLYAYSGAIYPDVGEGQDPYTVLGPRQAIVPTHIYRIIYRKTANGQWRTLAFVVPNDETASGTPQDYIVSLLELEKLTDLSFLPELPKSQSAAKEASDLVTFRNKTVQTGSSDEASETLTLPSPDSVPLVEDLVSSAYYQDLNSNIQEKLQNITAATVKITRRNSQSGSGSSVVSGVLLAPNLLMTADFLFDGLAGVSDEVVTQDLSINFGENTENLFVRDFREFPGRPDMSNIIVLQIDPIQTYDEIRVNVSAERSAQGTEMAAVGFPALNSRTPQVIVEQVFRSESNHKRILFGNVLGYDDTGQMKHDALTTGGVGGAPIVDLTTGDIVAVHWGGFFKGLKKENTAQPLSAELLTYVQQYTD